MGKFWLECDYQDEIQHLFNQNDDDDDSDDSDGGCDKQQSLFIECSTLFSPKTCPPYFISRELVSLSSPLAKFTCK